MFLKNQRWSCHSWQLHGFTLTITQSANTIATNFSGRGRIKLTKTLIGLRKKVLNRIFAEGGCPPELFEVKLFVMIRLS